MVSTEVSAVASAVFSMVAIKGIGTSPIRRLDLERLERFLGIGVEV